MHRVTQVRTSTGEPGPLAVRLSGITKRYGDLLANDDVSFDVGAGEIVGLLGENGAGKSTLVKVLYGLASCDGGQIEVDGRVVAVRRPIDAIRAGIGMVTQHFSLVGPMSIVDNVLLGASDIVLDRHDAAARIRTLSERVGLPVDPVAVISTLSVPSGLRSSKRSIASVAYWFWMNQRRARKKSMDYSRGVARSTSPSSSSPTNCEIRQMCSRVTVLRKGKSVGTFTVADCSNDQLWSDGWACG